MNQVMVCETCGDEIEIESDNVTVECITCETRQCDPFDSFNMER